MKLSRLLLLSVLVTAAASAQTNFYWGNTSTNWNNTGAWLGGTPSTSGGSNYRVWFTNSAATSAYTSSNDCQLFLLNQLILSNANGAVTNTIKQNTLAFISNGGEAPSVSQLSSGQFAIASALAFSNTTTFAGSGTGTITLSGTLSGSAGIAMNGNYTLVINNTLNNNSFTGGTVISNGVVQISGSGGNAAGTGSITLSGGTLFLNGHNGNTGTGGNVVRGAIQVTTNSALLFNSSNNSYTLNATNTFRLLDEVSLVFSNFGQTGTFRLDGSAYLGSNSAIRVIEAIGGNTLEPLNRDLNNVVLPYTATLFFKGPVTATNLTLRGGNVGFGFADNNLIGGSLTASNSLLVVAATNGLGTVVPTFVANAGLEISRSLGYTNSTTLTVDTNYLGRLYLMAPNALGSQASSITVQSGTLTFGASNSYSGALVFNSGTIAFSATNGYAGSSNFIVPNNSTLVTTVNGGQPFGAGLVTVNGTLSVQGTSGGTLFGVTNFVLAPGSTLEFLDTFYDRWEDYRTLALSNSTVRVNSSGSGTGPREQIGDLSFAGHSVLTSVKGSGASNRAQLNVNSNLVRIGRATLALTQGNAGLSTNNVGGSANLFKIAVLDAGGTELANTNGMLRIGNAPAPYVIDLGTASSPNFVRYLSDPAGGTGLLTVAYLQGMNILNSATPTDIIYVTNSTAVTTDRSVWAIRVGDVDITGFGTTITNGSGGVITIQTRRIEPNLYFGGAEAVFYTVNTETLAGKVIGTNGLTKVGGGTLIFTNAANELKGLISINEGTIQLGAGNGFGGTNDVAFWRNTTLDISTNRVGAPGNVMLGGLNSYATGALVTNKVGAPRTLTLISPATNTFVGTLAGSLSLVKDGTGTQILQGTNTYTGTTTIQGGSLRVVGNLGNTAVTVSNGANFSLQGNLGTGSGMTVLGNAVVDGRINQAINVDTGGYLAAKGTIAGNVIVADGATLAPGNSPGKLAFEANLTLSPGSRLAVNLDGLTAGASYDQLIVTNGTFTLGGSHLVVESVGDGIGVGNKFFLVRTRDGSSGEFAGTIRDEFGSVTNFGWVGYEFRLEYDVASTEAPGFYDIVLTVQQIPEPSALTLASAGLLLLLAVRRRR